MRTLLCGAVAVLTLLAASVVARAAEEEVPLDKLPKAVTAAVKKKFPKAELVKASKEDNDYEVTIKAEDTTIDVTVTDDGKIKSIEKTITAKQLPKAVADAVEEKYPNATHKKIEEITTADDKVEKYEFLLVTKDKKTLEVTFDPKGKFLEEEKKGEDKKEEKKDGKKSEKNQKGDNKDEKDTKKKSTKDNDEKDEQKGKNKKDNEDDEKKGKGKKDDEKSANNTVDLSKLPPDVAKKIRELVKELEKSGGLGGIYSQLLNEKVVDLLVQYAKLEDVPRAEPVPA